MIVVILRTYNRGHSYLLILKKEKGEQKKGVERKGEKEKRGGKEKKD